jgi:hypothetical protein
MRPSQAGVVTLVAALSLAMACGLAATASAQLPPVPAPPVPAPPVPAPPVPVPPVPVPVPAPPLPPTPPVPVPVPAPPVPPTPPVPAPPPVPVPVPVPAPPPVLPPPVVPAPPVVPPTLPVTPPVGPPTPPPAAPGVPAPPAVPPPPPAATPSTPPAVRSFTGGSGSASQSQSTSSPASTAAAQQPFTALGAPAQGSSQPSQPAPPFTVSVPAATPKSRVTLKGFSTSKKRIRNRGKKLTSTIIEFRLSRASVLVFVFRGPGPNCKVAARISAVGLAGLNRFRFHGYIGKRPLAPGTYLLVLRPKQSSTPLARTHLSIVPAGSGRVRQARPICESTEKPADLTEVLAAAPLLGALVGDFDTTPGATRTTPTAKKETESSQPRAGGTLGEQATESSGVPVLPGVEQEGDESSLVELIAAPALLALLFAALALLASRRRTQPPSTG